MKKIETTGFWIALKNSPHFPNFWCSEDFWKVANWKLSYEPIKGNYWWRISEKGKTIFPLLHSSGIINREEDYWCSFLGASAIAEKESDFLDFNFIYSPKNFHNMNGKSWATFRKNSRKWTKRNSNFNWINDKKEIEKALNFDLFIRWAEKYSEIEDGELLLKCFKSYRNQALLLLNGNSVAWMCWDYNYWAGNFRWLIVDPREAFLDEYCRHVFYSHQYFLQWERINDGGTLGKSGLLQFKRKMNPIMEIDIYSKQKKETENGIKG